MSDHTLTYEQVTALLAEAERKMRRCSDCDMFTMGAGVCSNGVSYQWLDCAIGHYSAVPDDVRSARELIRRAATDGCPDFTPAPEDQG